MGDRDTQICRIGRKSGREAEFGRRAQIIVPLMCASLEELRRQVHAATEVPHDLIEWRVDAFAAKDPAAISRAAVELMRICDVPLLATIRTIHEGGAADYSDGDYAALIGLVARVVDAVDVEIERHGAVEIIAQAQSLGAKVVASFHDFDGPRSAECLKEFYQKMDEAGANILKTAVMCFSAADVEAIWQAQEWAWHTLKRPIIGIGMGEVGKATRIVGMSRLSAGTFASLDTPSAPGQVSAPQVRMLLDQVECET